jgi:cytochrome c556
MKFVKAAVIGAVLIAGAAFAEGDRTDPNAKARSDLMRVVGKNTGILGDMAGGKAAYDAAAAEGAKAAIIEAAGMIEATFKDQGAADPASEAKPEIWANWDEFLADAKKLGDAAGAMDVASAETIGAGMGALGGACKDCHTEFRVMKQ